MNILYIATDVFFPFMNGGSRRAYETAKIFAKFGHKAVILVNRNSNEKRYERFESFFVYRSKLWEIGILLRKLVAKLPPFTKKDVINHNYETYLDKNPQHPSIKSKIKDFYRHKFPLHKIIRYLPAFPLLFKIVQQEKIDIIIERGPSYGVGGLIAKLTGRLYIVDFIDIMYWNFALKIADLVLSYFTTFQIPAFIPRSKVQRVFTATDVEMFRPQGRSDMILTKFQLKPDDFVCVYVGGMYSWHGLDVMVKTAKILFDRGIYDIKFLLVGDGPSFNEIKDLRTTLQVDDYVVMPGKVPFGDIPAILSTANVALSLNTGDSIGFKLIEYMASGVPIIATDTDNLHLIAQNGKDLLINNVNDPEHLVYNILYLRSNPQDARNFGINLRNKALKYFSWNVHYWKIIQGIRKIIWSKIQ